MQKFKVWKTVDAVLAGFYEDQTTGTLVSLLFGLYGDDGLLHFVGYSRVYHDAAEISKLIQPLKGGKGFTGRVPPGKSRWTGKVQKMVRLEPKLVAELSADHVSDGRFRTVRDYCAGAPTRRRKIAGWSRFAARASIGPAAGSGIPSNGSRKTTASKARLVRLAAWFAST